MPNHIINRFISIDDEDKFKELAINSKGELDFSILLPMPYSLDIVSCGQAPQSELDKVKEVEEEVSKDPFHNQLNDIFEKALEKGVKIATIFQYFNKKHYGVTDWYSWHTQKWGTKWNAYDQADEGKLFQTAWSTPEGWLKELAKHVDFKFIYSDEDRGNNLGFIEAVDGELEWKEFSNYPCSTELAYLIHEDEEDYIEEQIEYAKENAEYEKETFTDEDEAQLRKELEDKMEDAKTIYNDFLE
jgi:hypothetical protein